MQQLQKPKQGYKLVKSFFGKYEIPEEWQIMNLESCCNILDSKRIPVNSIERSKMKGDIPYYGANGVQDYISQYIFDEDLILLAEDGGYFNEFRTRPIAYYVQGKCWVNNHAHVLTNKIGYDLKWIFYSLVHKNILPWIKGSTRTKLNQSELRKIEIPISPLKEQQKIASILSNVDSLIQQTQKEIEQTQRLKKGLIQRLLTKGIGHTKFKNSDIGKIPEKWQIVRLEAACLKSKNSFSMGPFGSDIKTDNFVQSGVPVIRGINLTKQPFYEEGFVFVTENKADELKAANAFSGDLIFTHRGTLGQVGVIPFNSKFKRYVISQSQMKCTCDSKMLDPMFAFYFFISNSGQKIIMTHSTKSGVPHIIQPLTSLRDFTIPLPEIKEQKIIINFISKVNSLVEKHQEYKSKLEILKNGLMQKLLTGQTRVKA